MSSHDPHALAALAALLRSPLANLASVTVGHEALVAPGTERMIARVNGLAAQAQVWSVSIFPPPQDNPAPGTLLRGNNPWTSARVRWTIGNAQHEAELDPGAGTTIALAFDSLEVAIRYDPPPAWIANDADPVPWRVSVASCFGAIPPALPTRTISGSGDATIVVPKWARSVTPLIPAGAAPYQLDMIDPLGTILGSAYGVAGIAQPPPTIDLPNGTARVVLSGGPNIRWSCVFRLSI